MAQMPKSKPKMDRDGVLKLLNPMLSGLAQEKYPLLAFGIRAYYRDSMGVKGKNDRGIWDDAIGWIDRKTGGFLIFNGNTDPSLQFRKNLGCIHAPQVLWFKIGKHKGRPAFRQAASFMVDRDGVGLVKASAACAFNWHDSISKTNGTSSEGCQTMPRDQFRAAREYGYLWVPKYYKNETFPYLLTSME